ncbi:MAG: MFS transporter [Chloroflexota bacterium]
MRQFTTQNSYLRVLQRNHSFRKLWLGQVISLFGDWFNLIASAALIGQLSGSGMAVGGLFVLRMLAPFVVSPLAGVAADRLNRKYLLVASDLVRVFIVGGFLLVREPQDVGLLYGLTAIQLAISGFYYPARNAILPDLVSKADLGSANALLSVTWSSMLAFGAALGGLVSGRWGIYPAFMIDAATFLFSGFIVLLIPYHPPQTSAPNEKRVLTPVRDYLDGLKFLIRFPGVLMIAMQKGGLP